MKMIFLKVLGSLYTHTHTQRQFYPEDLFQICYTYSFTLSDIPIIYKIWALKKIDKRTSESRDCIKDEHQVDIRLLVCQLHGQETKDTFLHRNKALNPR